MMTLKNIELDKENKLKDELKWSGTKDEIAKFIDIAGIEYVMNTFKLSDKYKYREILEYLERKLADYYISNSFINENEKYCKDIINKYRNEIVTYVTLLFHNNHDNYTVFYRSARNSEFKNVRFLKLEISANISIMTSILPICNAIYIFALSNVKIKENKWKNKYYLLFICNEISIFNNALAYALIGLDNDTSHFTWNEFSNSDKLEFLAQVKVVENAYDIANKNLS